MSGKLYVVGIGPGDRDLVLPAAEKAIEQSDVVIGGKRNLELFSHVQKEKVAVGNNLEDICLYIKENMGNKNITVLASGDPGIFGIMEFMKSRFPQGDFQVIPGISSFQYLCAKLKVSWHDVKIISLHGREVNNLGEVIRSNEKVVIFTGGRSSPQGICKELVGKGLSHLFVTVGENLSYEDERIISGTPEELSHRSFGSLSIMLVQNRDRGVSERGIWDYAASGIPDQMFIRGQVPMTKEEVRAVTLSKLRLRSHHTVYDIGAGTGSVSVECALSCKAGRVFAIEKEEDAVDLIKQNISKFGLNNVEVIHGTAPEALDRLPKPDRIFIGGSCGNMEDILGHIVRSGGEARVVINAVAIESVYEAVKGLEKMGFEDVDIVCVSISRAKAAGSKHLMQALNPIYVISAEFGGEQ